MSTTCQRWAVMSAAASQAIERSAVGCMTSGGVRAPTVAFHVAMRWRGTDAPRSQQALVPLAHRIAAAGLNFTVSRPRPFFFAGLFAIVRCLYHAHSDDFWGPPRLSVFSPVRAWSTVMSSADQRLCHRRRPPASSEAVEGRPLYLTCTGDCACTRKSRLEGCWPVALQEWIVDRRWISPTTQLDAAWRRCGPDVAH